jgi:glycosyltransferase involved in cell wall biosynthesis
MIFMPQVTIIIPCYNEETRLPLHDYRQFLSEYQGQLVFVNDGSTDRTLDVLKELQKDFSLHVNILHLKKNMGKAEAVRRGILEASSDENIDIVGFMDADLSTPFEETGYFLDAFRDARFKMVFGSRISRIGANIQRFHTRHYFGRILATLVSIYLMIPIYDSQCGAKFFHAGFAKKLFAEPFVSRWLFDVEIFRRIALYGLNVEECCYELPLHTWIEKGDSKLVMRDYIQLPLEFYRIINHYLDKRNTVNISLLYRDRDERIQPSF